MTKKAAIALFRECYPFRETFMRRGSVDQPKLDQTWNDFVDGLNQEGSVTDRQRDTWTHPKQWELK